MLDRQYDAIVIGSGPAGAKLAQILVDNGKQVALIERDRFGGVCPNRGCFPKKILVTRAVTVLASRGANESFFSHGAEFNLDFKELAAAVHGKLEDMDSKKKAALEKNGITCIRGEGSLVGPGRVKVNDTELQAEHVVVATGCRPRSLSCEGSDLAINSAGFLKLEGLPEDILFIGAGYISLEFAAVALAAGKKVRVLTHGNLLLSQYDSRLTKLLRIQYETFGVEFRMNDTVQKIEALADNRFSIECASGAVLTSDLVVNATGRVPNLAELNLASVSEEFAAEDFRPDKLHYETGEGTNLYFIGDLTVDPELPFTTQAHKEATMVADFVLKQTAVNKSAIAVSAQSVFTYPELAIVSDEESLAVAKEVTEIYIESLSLETFYGVENTGALIKYDKESGGIYSVGIVAPTASEIINAFAMMIELKVSIYSLDKEIAAFPTIARKVIGAIAART